VSLPSLAEVEHADWPVLKKMAAGLGLNPKGRSAVVLALAAWRSYREGRPVGPQEVLGGAAPA